MAAKKESAALRGGKLIKKALASASDIISAPEPVPSALVRKLKLPNGESISPGMKELLSFDGSWIGIDFDEDEAEIEATSLEEIVEEAFGEEAVTAFGEAYEMLGEDCVAFSGDLSRPACLYIGETDDAGEYPVLILEWENGVARIGGFVPFDVWAAQELGLLEHGKELGDVPAEYAPLAKELADSNGDGRLVFTPKEGEAGGKKSRDDDDDEDEDEDDDDDDDEDEDEDEDEED
ncbi:MAG: hypothetical protein ABIP39_10540 [Polyangiaceae bacterium]